MSDAGSIGDLTGFLWQDGVMHDLNALLEPGFAGTITGAADIGENGHILASGSVGGQQVLVLLTPVPAPAAASVLTGAMFLRRRHR